MKLLALAILLSLNFGCSGGASSGDFNAANPSSTGMVTYTANVPQRLQWHENAGYCGETSFVTIGLQFGIYTSQYTMRGLDGNPYPQSDGANSELLIGAGSWSSDGSQYISGADLCTANRLGLTSTEFNYNNASKTKQFLKWIKEQLSLGYPVVIGVYLNENKFYGHVSSLSKCTFGATPTGCTVPGENCSVEGLCQFGDPEYDHIVTVTQIQTTHPCSSPGTCTAYDDDIMTIDDHGLFASECDYGNTHICTDGNQNNLCTLENTTAYQYLYPNPLGTSQEKREYSFGAIQRTRESANSPTSPVYSLCDIDHTNGIGNYGIAITGLQNPPDYSVSITVNNNFECPLISRTGTPTLSTEEPITLIVTVSGLTSGKSYNLYEYDSFASVPNSNWNTGCHYTSSNTPKNPTPTTVTATDNIYQFTVNTTADQTRIYRVTSG